MPDPLEPLNRSVWTMNRGILKGFLQPTSRVYRSVVPPPARQSIRDFTRNVTYPGRFVNNILQGRWQGAGDESLRFLCNTTAGVGGLFDVATKWNIPKSDADFSQTFGLWGWKPNGFLMLPFLGPSDDRNASGKLADELAAPLNYFYPYSLTNYASAYNNLSEKTEPAAQLISTESDSYVATKYFWTYGTKDESPDWKTTGPKDPATLETLGVAQIRTKDPRFIEQGRTRSVLIPSTGRKMKYSLWLQRGPAPLAFVSPGLGSHRVSQATLSIAEMLYHNGFTVVTIAGVFHPEFMVCASTSEIPAYPPNDCRDILVYLTEINRSLEEKHPGMIGKKALVGFSMGGFQALHLAATEKSAPPDLLRFDRYLAIDTPVNLHYAYKVIDQFSSAPQDWPAATRQERANNTVHKATKMIGLPPEMLAEPPFDASESRYLVGLSFRLTLRDTIFTSQMRNNMGVLHTPLSSSHREESYREIFSFSYYDYYQEFVIPYYKQRGITPRDFDREVNLRSYGKRLRSHKNTRVIVNSNDFLLNPKDISWLKTTFGPSRLTIFPSGGHIGNLASEPVQKQILADLDHLK